MLIFSSLANQIVRRHNNSVFDRITVRNVAKQIENLHWEDGMPDLSDEDDDEDEDLMRHGDDLTTDEYANSFHSSAALPKSY
jgi:hypothetical protein